MTDSLKTTILLVEDDDMFRAALRTVFEKAGYSLLIAEDGERAFEIFQERPNEVALLVSDIQMPGMTGPELARKLRLSRVDLKVILISANPQGVLMLDTGWYFLRKPFPLTAILNKVKQVLNGPSSTDQFSD